MHREIQENMEKDLHNFIIKYKDVVSGDEIVAFTVHFMTCIACHGYIDSGSDVNLLKSDLCNMITAIIDEIKKRNELDEKDKP